MSGLTKKCMVAFTLALGICFAMAGCIIPDTGQVSDCTPVFGEDSDYTDFPPSYTKLDAAGAELPDSADAWVTIQDNVTGLVWENKTNDFSIHHWDRMVTWQEAQDDFIAQLNEDNFGGFNDWWLPNVKELMYIANRSGRAPAIDEAYFQFTKFMDFFEGYWTITEWPGTPELAYYVNYDYGAILGSRKTDSMYVRAVRGTPLGNQSLEDNGDGTVTDWNTSLMWEQHNQDDYGPRGYWESALTYCEELSLGGFDDWRLPNINELTSLVDYTRSDPSIDTDFFPATISDQYWSSTTIPLRVFDDSAATVSFSNGTSTYARKSHGGDSQKFCRCVRSIEYTIYITQ